MKATIQLFKDVNGYWQWHLKAANGEVFASSEAYVSKQKCNQTVRRLSEATGLKVLPTSKR